MSTKRRRNLKGKRDIEYNFPKIVQRLDKVEDGPEAVMKARRVDADIVGPVALDRFVSKVINEAK